MACDGSSDVVHHTRQLGLSLRAVRQKTSEAVSSDRRRGCRAEGARLTWMRSLRNLEIGFSPLHARP